MENPTDSLRKTNLVLQLICESQIKSKTDKLELAKEKRGHFTSYTFVACFLNCRKPSVYP